MSTNTRVGLALGINFQSAVRVSVLVMMELPSHLQSAGCRNPLFLRRFSTKLLVTDIGYSRGLEKGIHIRLKAWLEKQFNSAYGYANIMALNKTR